MKTIARTLLALMLLSSSAFAGDLVNVAGASRIALNGYDPVAFFTDAKPVIGSPFIKGSYQGADYLFATEDHKTLFLANPEKYAPQYGGYCAYGVAQGALVKVEPDQFTVRDGKLYLNYDADVQATWLKDPAGYIKDADTRFPTLLSK